MEILSWNVNGIRSAARQGFFEWLGKEKPDILCLQETKCQFDQLELGFSSPSGYQSHWHCAQKPGYSGVAVYTSIEPLSVKEGIGSAEIDSEGRVITLEFKNWVLINAYFPNSQREHTRLGYKLEFCKKMHEYCNDIVKRGKDLVLCGDYNIAHQEIDLANPKTNMKNAGFLPEERAWMTQFLNSGYVDTFRHFVKEPQHYSWWSYRPGVRDRNIGWRIDYHCVNKAALKRTKRAYILNQVYGSDHCPVGLSFN